MCRDRSFIIKSLRFHLPSFSLISALILILSLPSSKALADAKNVTTSSSSTKKIRIYNWKEYLPEGVIKQFEKESGYAIELVHYKTDDLKDELIAQTNGQGLDLIIGSGASLVAYVQKQFILLKLDHNKIPSKKHVDPYWRGVFPELHDYAYPYLWGTLGIAYRKDKMQTDITSWNDLLKPHISLKGKILMINDARDSFIPALKTLGYSANTTDSKAIIDAGKLLANQRRFVDFGYIDLSEKSELVTGEYWMALAYNGDALTLKEFNENIEYVVPVEGSNIWVDYIAVFESSRHKKVAHQFINFIHRPEVAKEISLSLYFATTNKSAEALLPAEQLNNKIIYPDKHVIEKSEIYKTISGKTIGRYNNTFLNILNKTEH